MIKVSVIIPVYNIEAYLEKCLESLLAQTLEEIELIAVNDGSTDNSQQILDLYAAKSDKLRCFVKPNGGSSDARNFGFEHARGEYIGYVDSDDYVDPDMFRVMYEKAKTNDSDVVECNLHHVFPDGSQDTEIVAPHTDRHELLCFGRHIVWNKIYRRSWLKEIGLRFPIGLIYEDVYFVACLAPYVTRYDYVDIAPVYYVQRHDSVNNLSSGRTMNIIPILRDVSDFYRERGFFDEYRDDLEFTFARLLLCSSLARMCRIGDPSARKAALRENWSFLVNTFPNWRKNSRLRSWHTRHALFMKSINAFTYRIYCAVLPFVLSLRRFGRKWR